MTAGTKGIIRMGPLCCLAMLTLALAPIALAQMDRQAVARSEAIALEQKGLNAEAEKAWEAISAADPRNAEALAHLGLLEAREEQFAAAVDHYRQALAIKPDFPGLQLNLGLALFKAAQYPDAITFLSREIRVHPGDQRLTLLLGMAHYGINDYLVAIPYLEEAVSLDPRNLLLRTTLAHSCLWSKQFQCVLDLRKEALELNGESTEMDMLAAEALDAMNDLGGATQQLRAAVAAHPKDPSLHFGLGFVLWSEQHYLEAAREFQSVLDSDPGYTEARVFLADSWLMENADAKALSELEEIVASNTSDSLAHRDLGILYARGGRKEEAIHELKRAIELDPESAVSRRQIAQVYESMGRDEPARIQLDMANSMPPQPRILLLDQIDLSTTSAP